MTNKNVVLSVEKIYNFLRKQGIVFKNKVCMCAVWGAGVDHRFAN